MPITLGLTPQDLTVRLYVDGSFVSALVAPEDWPTGTVIELRFTAPPGTGTPTVWAATITGPRAEFYEADTAVRAVLDDGHTQVRLVCVDPGGRELLWGRGWVRVD